MAKGQKICSNPACGKPSGPRAFVESVDKNGILAWGLDKHNGFCHIYMGGDFQNKETQVWKTKHKLMKLKNKEEVS
ncbi:hypothetical protein EBS40_02805 [bacterium]|nr:hypothetical protein [bacterium]